MADQEKCTWCGNYGGTTWSRTIGEKKKQNSKQKFCSLKCKTQYDDRYGIEWVEEKSTNGCLVFIVILIVLYILSKS
jgi:hypothetical protein